MWCSRGNSSPVTVKKKDIKHLNIYFLTPSQNLTVGRCHPVPREPWTTASLRWKTSQKTHLIPALLNFLPIKIGDHYFFSGYLMCRLRKKKKTLHACRENSSNCRNTCVCSLAMCCRAPSIPEAQDMSRSSSNASSFASVVEENEGEEEYDTGQVGR